MDLNKLFQQVLLLSIQGSVLVIGILLIKAIFRQKLSAKLQYYIWFLLVLRLIIPFNIQSDYSIFNFIPAQYKQLDTSFIAGYDSADKLQSDSVGSNLAENKAVEDADKQLTSGSGKFDMNYKTASFIWLIGVSAAFLYIVSINMAMLIKLKKSPFCESREVIKILDDAKQRLKVHSKISIVYNHHLKSPAIYGFIRPKILIPREIIDRLTPEELTFILLHEVTHAKRKDLLVNTFLLMIQVVYWYNPFIWYALHQMKQDSEMACDATALSVLNSKEVKAYGQTIINMLQLLSEPRRVYGTLGFANKYSKRRIIMISRFRKTSVVWTIPALFLALLVGCSSTIKSADTISTISKINNEITDNSAPPAVDQPAVNTPVATTVSDNSPTKSSSVQEDSQRSLLTDIMKLAEQGKIINSQFSAKTTTIDVVERKLGKADKTDWVPAAKGSYATFSKYNVVFGFNKGEQIFEVRSFDNSLNRISLSMVKNAYGTPDYDVKNTNEEIIGYKAGNEYKILLVFPRSGNTNNDPRLDHYSVLYPKGTVNMMADDPGRQW